MHRSYRERIYPRYTSNQMPHFLEYNQADYEKDSLPILHRLRGWLPDNKEAHCLDVACGAGQLLYALKKAGYKHITGIDISPQQISIATQVCDDVHVVDALQYLQEHRGKFDLITGLDIIEHFTKDELFPVIDVLFAAMRPGGRLVLQTPNAESPWGLMQRYHDLTHELAFDPCNLKSFLSNAGFDAFEARECGPYIHGAVSLVRWMLWRSIAMGLRLWNLAETGSIGSGVYTRVFIAKADKPR